MHNQECTWRARPEFKVKTAKINISKLQMRSVWGAEYVIIHVIRKM